MVKDLPLGSWTLYLAAGGYKKNRILTVSQKQLVEPAMSSATSAPSLNKARFALIMPVRDEEKYIGPMMDSVLAQDILPSVWIIVDDGSTDKTSEIIKSYAERLTFLDLIQLPTRRERRAGGEGAISHALKRLELSKYDFLARFDADLLLESDYFSRLIEEFHRDPQLGIAGGGLYVEKDGALELEKVPAYHVRGALKMYRRECFEQIGGITTRIGWDTIDEVYAWTKGWKTRSFFDLRVIHRRPTGQGIDSSWIYWQRGKAEYYTWSAPWFVVAKTVKTALTEFSVLKAVSFLAGFASCYVNHVRRIQDPIFAETRRQQQWARVSSWSSLRQAGRNRTTQAGGHVKPYASETVDRLAEK